MALSESGSMRRHDPFLKALYKAGARDAVSLFFPGLASCVNWETIEWLDKEVPIIGGGGEESRAVVADLVGLTQDVEGSPLRVLLHPEVQMEAAADMGWRVLQYNAGLTLQQADPNARVLTIVFYHCRGGRRARGIRRQRHRLDFHGETTLEVGYWSVGIGDLDVEEYAAAANPMGWALAGWMRQPKRGRAALRLRLLGNILRQVTASGYRRLLVDAVETYFVLGPAEQAEEQRLLESGPFKEVKAMYDTVLGRLEHDAERKALQHALLTVLRSRFPSAPEGIGEEVGKLHDPEVLERLIRRASTASRLEEVLPVRGH